MRFLPVSLQKLISELSKLPAIGSKSAERLAYHLINNPDFSKQLQDSISAATFKVKFCDQCYFVSEGTFCPLCQDDTRNSSELCIVEKPADLIAIEQAGVYTGYYHVLHSLWAPLKGQGTEKMHLDAMFERIKTKSVQEVILATGSTVEGEATALYISKLLSENNVKATRLAQGLPKGGELEYLDDVTLSRALSGRTEITQS